MTEKKDGWVIPGDIPEHPTEKLVAYASGGRRWESEEMPVGTFSGMFSPKASEPLPETDDKAARSRSAHVALRSLLAEAEALRETARGRLAQCRQMAADMGLSLDAAEPEADYEALGYPETSYGYQVEVDSVRVVPDVMHRWLHSLADNPTDKEYDTTSITVDDKTTD